ncbi:MAG: PEP-CTERM sorting domain-containing protein [Planctomycetota bacterium]
MKKFFALSIAALLGLAFDSAAHAEIVLSTTTYSQNFDNFGTTTVTNVFSSTIGTIANIPNLSSEWDGAKIGGTGTAATNFVADTGAGTSGGIYNYGASLSSDRALGAVASGTNIMGFGFQLRNSTGETIDSITIGFTQENWRSSTSIVNTIAASYATSASGATSSNYLTASGFTTVSDLNLVGPAPVASNGALNGNDAANQVSRSTTISGLTFLAGDVMYFRWQDVNDAGNDAGLAIDNFNLSVTTTAVPEPTSLALVGMALGTGAWARFRRRSQNR